MKFICPNCQQILWSIVSVVTCPTCGTAPLLNAALLNADRMQGDALPIKTIICSDCAAVFVTRNLLVCACPRCGKLLSVNNSIVDMLTVNSDTVQTLLDNMQTGPSVDDILQEFYKFRFCYNTFAILKRLPRIGLHDSEKVQRSLQFHMSARRKISEYLQPQQLYIENNIELLPEKYQYQYEAIKHVIETEEAFQAMAKTYNVRITSPFILTSSQVKSKLGPGYRIVEITTETEAPPKPIVDVDSAVVEIINAGYRALARANHPDLVGDADNPDIAERDRRTQVMVTLNRAKKELVALLEMVKG